MSLGEGMRLATGTFTRRTSGPVSVTPQTARSALLLAPVAVLPLALQVTLISASVELGVPPLVAAGAALAVLAHGSRAMHLDGLADTVDGLGAGLGKDPLEVMRRGDVGPMGAVALVLVLLVQVGAITALLGSGWRGALLVGAAVIASRAAAAVVCGRGQRTAAGSRLGAAFVGTIPFAAAALLTLVVAAVLVAAVSPMVVVLRPDALGDSSTPLWLTTRMLLVTALAAPIAMLAAVRVRDKAARVIGGVNGDVIGAGVEVALTVVLVLLTVAW
ncbi:adenosylcobinamide-GDP ribazoletransferase [Janibacter limosus]|uniref:adenosylcobinamide-GDP ribazoletransferase n=1 Tax=Janibacter limosus TaxID=53458 RepID=UPI00082F6DB8|nr:adenosylcobinamide-GDP ribazoletransferase [Janibacter limosus]